MGFLSTFQQSWGIRNKVSKIDFVKFYTKGLNRPSSVALGAFLQNGKLKT